MLKKNVFVSIALGFLIQTSICHAFYTADGEIYDANNQIVKIDGISWSGFQDSKIVQGLSSNTFYEPGSLISSFSKTYGMLDAIVRPWDYADTKVTKSTGVSFKTLRLPMQPGVLYDTTNEVEMNKSLTNKNSPTKGNGIFCKTWETNGMACAKTVSPQEAFWITIEEMKKNNVKVMIDFHHRSGYGDGYRDGTVYDLTQYKKDIKLITDEIKSRNLTNVIGIDIFNEPYRLSWFRDGSQVAWIKVIAAAAEVLQQNKSDLLVFVEGAGPGSGDPDQPPICIKTTDLVANDEAYSISDEPAVCAPNTKRVYFKGNWGEDFKPLLKADNAKQGEAVFDRTNFTQKLTAAGLNNEAITWLLGDSSGRNAHFVISPHVYPREVGTWESAPGTPSELRFNWSWNFMKKSGYPVVLGESSWKSSQGLAFFNNSIVPFLVKNNQQNGLFFWAIGYLGDTISLIDPNNASLNLQAEQVLHDLYNQNIASGKVNITFGSPGVNIQGGLELTIAETNQKFTCSYSGCSQTLDAGTYHINVSNIYQIDNTAHMTYLIKSQSSPLQFTITNGQTTALNIPLEAEQVAVQPATSVTYTLNMLDANGVASNVLYPDGTLTFTSQLNSQRVVSCPIKDGKCITTIYNQNLNSQTGVFGSEQFTVNLAKQVTANGNNYNLNETKSDKVLTVSNSTADALLNAYYNQSTSPPVPSGQGCSVNFAMQNRWGDGAVLQGSLKNTGQATIRSFTIKLSFNYAEITNPQIPNLWIGSNAMVVKQGDIFTLSAKTYDQYNGLKPNQEQSIGFVVQGQVLKDINVTVLSCEAK